MVANKKKDFGGFLSKDFGTNFKIGSCCQ